MSSTNDTNAAGTRTILLTFDVEPEHVDAVLDILETVQIGMEDSHTHHLRPHRVRGSWGPMVLKDAADRALVDALGYSELYRPEKRPVPADPDIDRLIDLLVAARALAREAEPNPSRSPWGAPSPASLGKSSDPARRRSDEA